MQHGEINLAMKRKTEKELAILHVLSHISMELTQDKETKGYLSLSRSKGVYASQNDPVLTRVFKEKSGGVVVDYLGILESLKKARNQRP